MVDANKNAIALLGNGSKLVRFIFAEKWNAVRRLLQTQRGVHQVEVFNNSNGLTILSKAASINNPPADIIRRILEIEPSHSLQVDAYKMLPLHIACLNGASSETIKVILDHDDGACTQAIDMFKRAPLHYAVQYMCDPELKSCFDHTSSSGDGSAKVGLFTNARNKRASASNCSSMTMSQDRFHDQMRVIELLVAAGPEIVMFADDGNRTPIDVLQDCKAESREGSKWERADIACEVLRKTSLKEYRNQKIVWELEGYQRSRSASNSLHPSMASSNNSASATSHGSYKSVGSYKSGATGLSKLEIDCTSYNQMDVSLSGESKKEPQRTQTLITTKIAECEGGQGEEATDMDVDME